jgi:hypothetical protein
MPAMASVFGMFVILVASLAGLAARAAPPAQSDLDDFMSQVLQRRDENWKKLQQYILDERERFVLEGPAGIPIWGEERTYMWYIREGFFVRSPVTVNGVNLSDADRRRF